MKVCIPVNEDNGIRSSVCSHFGAAPYFLLVDSETSICQTLPNQNQHHEHGQCQPLAALRGQQVDAMIVGGIGMGALTRMQAAGIRVYRSDRPIAEDALSQLRGNLLVEVDPARACSGHGHHQ